MFVRGSKPIISALKLPRFDVVSDAVVSRDSIGNFGAARFILRVSVVVVMEISSGFVRKFTVGNVAEVLTRGPIVPVARDLISLEVCLNATRSRIMVGTIDLRNQNEIEKDKMRVGTDLQLTVS